MFCQSIAVFRLVSESCAENRLQVNLVPRVFFKYATCQTSLAGKFRQNLEKYPSKKEKIFSPFYTQSND